MKRKFCLILCGVLWTLLPVMAQTLSGNSLSLIPYPMNVLEGSGSFVFQSKTVVVLEDAEFEGVVSDFLDLLKESAGFAPKLKLKGKKGDVYILKDESIKDEGYVLNVLPDKMEIKASGVKGVFYALQTLRQLLPAAIEGKAVHKDVVWSVPAVSITDEPRFGYRGLMLDVARFFLPKEHLLRIIDCMGMMKLNKLHLHLTDDNGWRLEIKRYPLLTEVGSKKVPRPGQTFPERRNARQGESLVEGGFYTQDDIKEIVAYAASRQIEVIPEIAMPRHCNAALAAYPMLACPVIDKYIGAVPGLGGDHTYFTFCAGNEEVFTFLQHVIDEVVELFPSQYIHLGGDVIRNTHWEECPLCRERLKKERLDDENDLLGYFMQRIDRYVRGKGRKVMGWEELMDANLSKGAVVFEWHGYGHGAVKAGKHGHHFIVAPTGVMYLNTYQGPQWQEPVLSFGGNNSLKNIYHYEPVERYWTMSMREHLLGVQASLWTEFCEKEEDVDYLLFPRLGAIAEAVWSVPMSKKWERFLSALDDYQERWEMKGIRPSQSMFNVQHEVVSDYGSFKVSLECIRPDVEIRYTTDGREPDRFSSQYWRPLTLKEAKVVKCATFKNGKKKGQTLVLPIHKKGMPVKNLLRSNHVERRVMNGVRGTLKNTDGEWASWTKNDSIALVFDVGGRKRLERISFGVLNDFGLGIHKPKKVEVWLSDNEMLYWKLAEKEYDEAEIFREGRFVEDLKFDLGDMARYVRLVVRGVGECPEWHVRPGLEAQIYIDEVSIE